MDNKNQSSQGISMEEAKKLAQSEIGKKLFSTLQQTHGDKLHAAMAQASSGNYSEVKKAVTEMLNTPEVKEFFRQLGGSKDG